MRMTLKNWCFSRKMQVGVAPMHLFEQYRICIVIRRFLLFMWKYWNHKHKRCLKYVCIVFFRLLSTSSICRPTMLTALKLPLILSTFHYTQQTYKHTHCRPTVYTRTQSTCRARLSLYWYQELRNVSLYMGLRVLSSFQLFTGGWPNTLICIHLLDSTTWFLLKLAFFVRIIAFNGKIHWPKSASTITNQRLSRKLTKITVEREYFFENFNFSLSQAA